MPHISIYEIACILMVSVAQQLSLSPSWSELLKAGWKNGSYGSNIKNMHVLYHFYEDIV